MAIYKIFPEKSATLYSYYPTLNTGLDEILELSTFLSIDSTNEVSRILLKFPTSDINSVFTNNVKTLSISHDKINNEYLHLSKEELIKIFNLAPHS